MAAVARGSRAGASALAAAASLRWQQPPVLPGCGSCAGGSGAGVDLACLGRRSASSASQAVLRRRTFVEFTGPGSVFVGEEELPVRRPGEATVRTLLSAVSAGTERKVLEGNLVASAEPADVSIDSLGSEAPRWPLRYGYALLGRVEDPGDSALRQGSRIFCFHPHASAANVSAQDVREVPGDVLDADAAFFASMETALSLVQDATPVLGDRVAVFGAGAVGALATALLSHQRFEVSLFEPNTVRGEALRSHFPTVRLNDGEGFDALIETSGSPRGLAQAMELAGRGARLVAGSWYGEAAVPLPLGLRYHRSELTLVASQVSRISAPLSARWGKDRRAALAWRLLAQLRPSTWVPLRYAPVEDAAEVYAWTGEDAVQVLLTYDSPEESRSS